MQQKTEQNYIFYNNIIYKASLEIKSVQEYQTLFTQALNCEKKIQLLSKELKEYEEKNTKLKLHPSLQKMQNIIEELKFVTLNEEKKELQNKKIKLKEIIDKEVTLEIKKNKGKIEELSKEITEEKTNKDNIKKQLYEIQIQIEKEKKYSKYIVDHVNQSNLQNQNIENLSFSKSHQLNNLYIETYTQYINNQNHKNTPLEIQFIENTSSGSFVPFDNTIKYGIEYIGDNTTLLHEIVHSVDHELMKDSKIKQLNNLNNELNSLWNDISNKNKSKNHDLEKKYKNIILSSNEMLKKLRNKNKCAEEYSELLNNLESLHQNLIYNKEKNLIKEIQTKYTEIFFGNIILNNNPMLKKITTAATQRHLVETLNKNSKNCTIAERIQTQKEIKNIKMDIEVQEKNIKIIKQLFGTAHYTDIMIFYEVLPRIHEYIIDENQRKKFQKILREAMEEKTQLEPLEICLEACKILIQEFIDKTTKQIFNNQNNLIESKEILIPHLKNFHNMIDECYNLLKQQKDDNIILQGQRQQQQDQDQGQSQQQQQQDQSQQQSQKIIKEEEKKQQDPDQEQESQQFNSLQKQQQQQQQLTIEQIFEKYEMSHNEICKKLQPQQQQSSQQKQNQQNQQQFNSSQQNQQQQKRQSTFKQCTLTKFTRQQARYIKNK